MVRVVIANVKTINQLKKDYGSIFPLLTWQFVAFGHNEHEIDTAREMARELNMDFGVKLSWDAKFSPVKDQKLVRNNPKGGTSDSKQRRDSQSPRKINHPEQRSNFPEAKQRPKHDAPYLQKQICTQLWNIPQINWDGRVLGCCVNYWGDFGNVLDDGLTSALNGDELTYARRMLRGLEGPKAEIPCSTCAKYKWMRANEAWITEQDIKTYRGGLRKMPYATGRFGNRLVNRFPGLARTYVRLLASPSK
jgi:hypothetical protein